MKNMFIDPLKNLASYNQMIEDIKNNKSPIYTHGIISQGLGHMAFGLPSQKKAKQIYEDIKHFNQAKVEIFPTREMLFYKVDAISSERLNQRLKVLSRLVQGEEIILVASI